MRLIPVMLALLLALSPGAVALQASAPIAPTSNAVEQADGVVEQTDTVRPAQNENTTTVMTLGSDPARTGFDTPSLALGSSLAMERDGFRSQLGVGALDHQLENVESEEKKKQILNRYLYQIENRIISLKAEEKRVMQAFSNGTISEREFLRALGHIDAEADDIRAEIDALKDHSADTQFRIDDNSLKAKLATVEGPVRDRIVDTMRGNAQPTRIYVSTADTGIVLSTIDNGEYVREVYRADYRDPSEQQSITVEEANEQVIQTQYPWISEPDRHWTGSDRRVYPPIQVIRYIYEHSHGSLTAYVDMGTAKVYREVQHKQLTGEDSLPPGPGVVNASENVTLTVNRTYPGGPLRVQLTNSTGAPLQGQVTVAGEPAGRTNAEGVLWTLGPAEEFEVNATYDGTTVNVTTAPVDPDS